MAKFIITYRCPECGGKFTYPAQTPQDAPDRCGLCAAWMSFDEPTDKPFVPKAPRIRKNAYAKSIDKTFRAMETSSIARADEAAGILESAYAAQPREEHDGLVRATQQEQVAKLRSELKITDMKDPSNMRAGDTAAIAPSPLTATGAGFQPYAGSVSGASVSSMVPTIQRLTTDHSSRATGMIRAGNLGTFRGR